MESQTLLAEDAGFSLSLNPGEVTDVDAKRRVLEQALAMLDQLEEG